MASKKGNDYFSMFVEMVDTAVKAVEQLSNALHNFDPANTLQQQMDDLHAVESTGDRQKHLLLQKLTKEFITPIEREDILSLANELDDVTDSIEDILLNLYMYNIQTIRPEALEFIVIVEQCCKELRTVMTQFGNFKKSDTLKSSIVELNRLEEVGDRLYTQAVHTLYVEQENLYETIGWTEVYRCFEKCCDTCEHVSDVVESAVMGNS